MLHKIRCNPMHPLYGALQEPYVSLRVTRGAACERTSEHLCASSLQNLAVPQNFHCSIAGHIHISVGQSW